MVCGVDVRRTAGLYEVRTQAAPNVSHVWMPRGCHMYKRSMMSLESQWKTIKTRKQRSGYVPQVVSVA